ncbi:ergothioneine biosynthesis protein EgtC [Dactylosporangium aurantiacum]|uniref:Gamma-glutamyl-hercynylcysteine sulfoxide hydrolase n=1 Tax=Dactylosporangium aurantiacum TaxID=35754 RepID=A0A9Q9MB63_9ACTN|nr:ergothioneine biosynthesis protein EgtC [Dactylosporangium aurantiacum]MDG6101601.1 ergothioneine biosynthesis protein EgtC [Dactylosporangium aurantiacum]UWZ52568.1 ergothioneine biosynthesis protein EgtC [Dactylosporangium aurantiacum]
MCRHLVYLGPPAPLSRLLFDPPHGLEHQSWAPRDMRGGGTINADGFGLGWFPSADLPQPVVYRSARPLWSDLALPALAAATTSGAVLAAVRSATAGMPVTESAAAPFHDGPWLFSHNGRVTGWPDSVTGVAAGLPVRDLITLDAPTDSALLWALVRARLRAGGPLGDTLSQVVGLVAAAAPGSRLNLLLTDGRSVAAVTYGHALSVRAGDGTVLVASEPLDDGPAWRPVPEHSLLVADPSAVHISEGIFS